MRGDSTVCGFVVANVLSKNWCRRATLCKERLEVVWPAETKNIANELGSPEAMQERRQNSIK